MRLVADHGVDTQVVVALGEEGLSVRFVAEVSPGMTDPEVSKHAIDADAVLPAADNDFGELVFRQGLAARGVVLPRLAGLPETEKAATVRSVLQLHGQEMPGAFTVITERAVRVRRMDRG